jgi:hypothetical protein
VLCLPAVAGAKSKGRPRSIAARCPTKNTGTQLSEASAEYPENLRYRNYSGDAEGDGVGDSSELLLFFFEGEAEASASALVFFFVDVEVEVDAEVSSPLFFLAVVEVELVLVPVFFAPVDFFVVVSWVVAAVVELDVVSLFLAQETTNAIATKAVMERAIFFIGFCVRFSRLSAATRKTSNLLRPLPLFLLPGIRR